MFHVFKSGKAILRASVTGDVPHPPFLSIGMFTSHRAHSLFPASEDAYTRGQRINENPLERNVIKGLTGRILTVSFFL